MDSEMNFSFTELLTNYEKTAGEEEATSTTEETSDEVTAEPSDKTAANENDTGETTKLSGIDWLKANQEPLSAYATKVASYLDNDENREVFGRCLDAVTLLKVGGYLSAEEQDYSAKDIAHMAYDLYRRLP